jgi:hypothetical protein
MECRRNEEDYGIKVSNHALAVMIARAVWASVKCLKTRREIEAAFEPWVLKWFDDHEKADEAKIEIAAAKAEKQVLKEQGLSKLSVEEKIALGLPI